MGLAEAVKDLKDLPSLWITPKDKDDFVEGYIFDDSVVTAYTTTDQQTYDKYVSPKPEGESDNTVGFFIATKTARIKGTLEAHDDYYVSTVDAGKTLLYALRDLYRAEGADVLKNSIVRITRLGKSKWKAERTGKVTPEQRESFEALSRPSVEMCLKWAPTAMGGQPGYPGASGKMPF